MHVDLDEVAGLRRALDRDERRGLLAQPLELGVDLVGRNLDVLLHALELERLGQRARGLQRELGGERERLALARDRLEVDARPVGRAQAGLRDRLADPGGQELAHRLLEDLLAAHALQHDGRRHLALAEAGDLGAVHEVPERVPQVVVDPVGLELHLQPRAAVLQHGGRRPHRIRTLDDSLIEHLRHPGRPLRWARAGVAELVDAPDLGSGERELVEVRVLSPASPAGQGAAPRGLLALAAVPALEARVVDQVHVRRRVVREVDAVLLGALPFLPGHGRERR